MKKKFVALLSIVAIATAITLTACSQHAEPTAPEISTDLQAYIDAGQRRQYWIERMDPFVKESSQGLYTLDWEAFAASIKNDHADVIRVLAAGDEPNADAETVRELRDGIPVINDLMSRSQGSPESAEVLGSACWWYWWGRRCCYWGSDGWQIVASLGAVGSGGAYFLPGFGAVAGSLSAYLAYFMSVYNGFCVNMSWIGNALWISRP